MGVNRGRWSLEVVGSGNGLKWGGKDGREEKEPRI